MSLKVFVHGLSALTDGHIGLYGRLKEYGHRHRVFYSATDRMPTATFDIEMFKLPKNRMFALLRFVMEIVRERPQLVEFYLHDFGRLGGAFDLARLYACRLLGVQITVVCTGREILNFNELRRDKKFAVRAMLAHSKYYLIKEVYMRASIARDKIADPERALFIHNGVYEDLHVQTVQKCKNVKYVLFFNSFKRWRNVPFLVEAAKRIVEKRSDVVFLIVGARNDDELAQVGSLLEGFDKSQAQRIQAHRMSDHKLFYFGLSHLFVLPADIVWLNNSLLEAMQLRVPVLIPDVDAADLIVKDRVSGFIYRHHDLDSFVSAITAVLDMDPDLVGEVTAEAHDYVCEFLGSRKRALLHHAFYGVLFDKYEVPPGIFDSDLKKLQSFSDLSKQLAFCITGDTAP